MLPLGKLLLLQRQFLPLGLHEGLRIISQSLDQEVSDSISLSSMMMEPMLVLVYLHQVTSSMLEEMLSLREM